MYVRRRAASTALALTALLSVVACTEADNGNNTLAGREPEKTATSSAPGGPASTAPAQSGKDVELEAKDNEFAPKTLSVAAGDVTIVMKNTGAAPHTFTNTDLGVDVNADAGKTAEVKLTGLKAGTYKFVCKYHESLGMVGELTVT